MRAHSQNTFYSADSKEADRGKAQTSEGGAKTKTSKNKTKSKTSTHEPAMQRNILYTGYITCVLTTDFSVF